MSTPAAPIGGGDIRADIAATLSAPDPAPLQSGPESTPAAPSEPAAAPPVQKAPDAVPSAPAAPQGQPTPQEDEFSINLDEEPTPEEGPEGQPESQEPGTAEAKPGDPDAEIGALLATTRGKRIYADFKKGQQLAKLPDEGGIGHNPSAEQVTDYFHAYTDRQNMQHDFSAGVPEAADAWASYWFGPDDNGAFRDGALQVAAQLPEFLVKTNPKAYEQMAVPIADRYVKAALGRFKEAMNSTGDAAEREKWWTAAACLHKDLYGEWPDPATFTGQPQQTVQKPDRNADEVTRLREENARLRQSEQTQRQQAIDKQIGSRTDAALFADVDTALKSVKDVLDPVLYADAREQFVSKVKAALAKDRDSERLFQIRRANATRRGDEAEIAALVKQYRQRAFTVITELRKGYIKAAGVKAVEKSTERHTQLQQAAQKVAPAAGGAPIAQDIKSAVLERLPGESNADYRRREIKELYSH